MTLVVKCRLPTSDDVRRFCLKIDTTFNALVNVLQQIYPKLPNFTVKYQLNDTDIREINTELEFRQAVAFANGSKPPILRLIVHEAPVKPKADLMDASWIFVPNTEIKEEKKLLPVEEPSAQTTLDKSSSSKGLLSSLPSIFGFQLPSFVSSPSASPSSSYSSSASSLSNSSSVESKILAQLPPLNAQPQEEEESEPMDIETIQIFETPSVETPTPTVEEFFTIINTKPLRVTEVCARLSEETKNSCISFSNSTTEDSAAYSKTVSGLCSDSSAAIKALCHRESDSMLLQLGSSPASAPKATVVDTNSLECAKLSQETSRMCSALSKDTASASRSEERTVLNSCSDLSKTTADECRALSRSIVSEILAL